MHLLIALLLPSLFPHSRKVLLLSASTHSYLAVIIFTSHSLYYKCTNNTQDCYHYLSYYLVRIRTKAWSVSGSKVNLLFAQAEQSNRLTFLQHTHVLRWGIKVLTCCRGPEKSQETSSVSVVSHNCVLFHTTPLRHMLPAPCPFQPSLTGGLPFQVQVHIVRVGGSFLPKISPSLQIPGPISGCNNLAKTGRQFSPFTGSLCKLQTVSCCPL